MNFRLFTKVLVLGLLSEISWSNPPQASHIMKSDTDGDGKLSFAEFEASPRVARSKMSEQNKKALFKRLDRDKDGYLSLQELKSKRPHPIEQMLAKSDTDKNGEISWEEFTQAQNDESKTKEQLEKRFKRLDRNRNGVLDKKDITRRDWHRNRLKAMDLNKDGSVSREEWDAYERFKKLPKEKRDKMFDRLDKNKDGVIDKADRPQRDEKKRSKKERKPKASVDS